MTERSQVSVRVAKPDEREAALSLLYPERSPSEVTHYVRELTSADSTGDFSLSDLHVAVAGSKIVGTGLLSFAAGRVALLWPPEAVGSQSEAAKSQLMDAMLRCIDASDAAFGQALLPLDHGHAGTLSAAGMKRITSLSFLSRDISKDAREASRRAEALRSPTEVSFVDYEDVADDARTTKLLAETHIDSADCHEVSRLLRASDLLDGHLATGRFRGDLSFLVTLESSDKHQRDVGIAILSEHAELTSIEMVYIGIVPSARRRGLGRKVMQEAIRRAQTTSAATMFLAVDQRNLAARLLYERLGFYTTDEQEVWLYVPCRS